MERRPDPKSYSTPCYTFLEPRISVSVHNWSLVRFIIFVFSSLSDSCLVRLFDANVGTAAIPGYINHSPSMDELLALLSDGATWFGACILCDELRCGR